MLGCLQTASRCRAAEQKLNEEFLADVTYVHADGFTGIDRIQVFVQGGPIRAANREAPSAELSMVVMVQLAETMLPPATVEMPRRLNAFEDSART